ncbi:MAG: hypothetical protein IJJ50_04430 [Lachnospiraceae bacterium]|nr:hypothetical protein [Lachnospiraceae bacterium]
MKKKRKRLIILFSVLLCLLFAVLLLISCGTPKSAAESTGEETSSEITAGSTEWIRLYGLLTDKTEEADVICYSATMESPLSAIDDLLDINPLFADFKAVRDNMVFTTDGSLFQRADICGEFTEDVRSILQGQENARLQFLTKVE